MKPIILAQGHYSDDDIANLRSQQKIWQETDLYRGQLAELFEVLHPDQRFKSEFNDNCQNFVDDRSKEGGSWIYFPWSGQLIHSLAVEDYYRLRVNRNQNLITADEQAMLKDFSVGVLGLSVGGGMAVAMAYSGISSNIKIADFDDLDTTNLNRVHAGLKDVGTAKIDIMARQIYEINPFTNVVGYRDGLTEDNLADFYNQDVKLNVVIDEIDDFMMKVRVRQFGRTNRTPVLMFTSLGDNILVDVERYDIEPDLEIFNGLLGDIPEEILNTKIGEKEKVKYAMKLVGVDYIPTRALSSLFEINKTLLGRPQLFSTIAIDGGLAAYFVRKLALGHNLPSGRYYLSLNQVFGFDNNDDSDTRQAVISKLDAMLGDA